MDLTSLSRQQALPEHVEWFWRQHWTIENTDHYVRDAMREGRLTPQLTGRAAQPPASRLDATPIAPSAIGLTNVAAALRHFGSSPQLALRLIGTDAT